MSEQNVVSPTTFRLLWIGIVVAYSVCGSVLVAYGLLYFLMLRYAVDVLYNVELLGVQTQPSLYPYMGIASLGIALVHFYQLSTMIWRSIQARSLQFSWRFSRTERSRVSQAALATINATLPSRSSYFGYAVRRLGVFAVGLWKAFDVTSPNYGVVYLIREIVQTGIQTQQAYEMSARVTKLWMNQFFVVLLVLNCWAMPLIHHGLKIPAKLTLRLYCLVINLALDFVSYFAVPIALFVPYARGYNYKELRFDANYWYTETWIMQLPSEWPLVFVTSIGGGLARLLIIFSMTRTLRSIAKLLQPANVVIVSDAVNQLGPYAPASIIPVTLRPEKSFSTQTSRPSYASILRRRLVLWGHRLLILWGLIILVLHVYASSTRTNRQCILQVRPWFVSRSACSLMEMNCYNTTLTSSATEFNAMLDSIDSQWVSYLVIRHCSAVEVTRRIQDLSMPMGVKIYNSTLVKWDSNAALTQTHHPNVLFVLLLATNVSKFPEALYHSDFPAKLKDIEISDVNLTKIPMEIGDLWHPKTFLVLEKLQLAAFPSVLRKLQPSFLSLACNQFTEIPAAILQNPELLFLNLNGNPIVEIPPGDFKVASLHIVETKITKIPTWMATGNAEFELMAGSTPLCDAFRQRNTSALGLSSDTELGLWERRVDCTPSVEYGPLTSFPLEEEETNNPSRSE